MNDLKKDSAELKAAVEKLVMDFDKKHPDFDLSVTCYPEYSRNETGKKTLIGLITDVNVYLKA